MFICSFSICTTPVQHSHLSAIRGEMESNNSCLTRWCWRTEFSLFCGCIGHPCLHKLATTRPAPHPRVISLIDGKLKNVNKDMTREDLVEHCRDVIRRQRPSSRVNEAHVNGEIVGPNDDNMIIHEHVMHMMMRTKQPLHQSDINVPRDFAQRLDRCEGKRVLAAII